MSRPVALADLGPGAPDGDVRTLHLRCGDDIRSGLAEAGFAGDFGSFPYPFVHGPAFPVEDRAGFVAGGARFLADVAFEPSESAARAALEAGFGLLDIAARYDRVCLWFEHDAYDQLCLAFLLAWFGRNPCPADLRFVCCEAHPSVERFIGIGQLSPKALLGLWDDFAPVTEDILAWGVRTWRAVCSADPTGLWEIARNGTPEVPCAAAAFLRQLRELPGRGDGLSYTERLALAVLRDRGPLKAGELFRAYVREYEPLPFMGDLGFRDCVLLPLSDGAAPAIAFETEEGETWWRATTVSLTDAGEDYLDTVRDWRAVAPGRRWVCGVRVDAGTPDWRWCDEAGRPVLL